MISHAVVYITCTLYNQPSPDRSLLNTLEKPTDLVRLIAHMSDKGIHTILFEAVMLLRADDTYGPRMSNCWLPAATWVEGIRKSGHIDASLVIDVRKFNTAMSKSSLFGELMMRFDGSNATGVFRINYQHQYFYYFTEETRQVAYPHPLNSAWKEKVVLNAANVLTIPSTRGRPSTVENAIVMATTRVGHPGTNENENESPHKRQRVVDNVADSSCLYWPESPEAYQLFRPREYSGVSVVSDSTSDTMTTESPQEALERRIIQLQAVHESEDSWRGIVKGGDPDNVCTKAEVFEIRQRATFLCLAYQLALANMNKWTWHHCCKVACQTLNSLGMHQATFFKTIAQWNMVFRKLECFPHPNPYVQCGKRPLPRLLEVFPDAKDQIVAFGVRNLATLTIESLHDFIVSTVIPRLASEWRKDAEVAEAAETTTTTSSTTTESETPPPADNTNHNTNQEVLNRLFLRAHRLEKMSFSTAWRWMRLLGFRYDTRRKSFYVDGHERDDVVANRTHFCKNYLTDLEPYCNRWIQVSIVDAMAIKDLDIGFGHRYFDIVGNKERIEFHVDYWNHVKRRGAATLNGTRLDAVKATTSIRVSSKARPTMIVGQDESVFAQYLLGAKTWIGPKGQRPLLPKSEGDGYMLSAFVSREFGFGRLLTNDELVKINSERRTSTATYTDKHAAMEILGTINKPVLTESPFVKYLYIGINNEGYWNSYHMSLQFEDVVDCLQVLYPDYDLVFMFDHSQGHARQREHALSAQQMSKSYGGAQPRMRDTTIMTEEGFLGPHLPSLCVADTQSLVFQVDDVGPWYLSEHQQRIQRHDRPTGKTKVVERSKKVLLEALKDKGVTLQQQRGYTKKELQDFARNNGIEVVDTKEQIAPGWEGKPKGLMQVLGERGLINRALLEQYTLEGRKDAITGMVDLRYSLRHLLAECHDFKDEETALQYLGSQLGVVVNLTPKFHAELAGEGVEYSWAHAKAFYRRMPLSRKRGRDNFKQLVKDCTCPVNVLTKERIEKFASRARAYICTYHYLEQQQLRAAAAAAAVNHEDPNATASSLTRGTLIPTHIKQELLYSEIERLKKDFKCHRCVLDFDSRFVHSELRNARVEGDML